MKLRGKYNLVSCGCLMLFLAYTLPASALPDPNIYRQRFSKLNAGPVPGYIKPTSIQIQLKCSQAEFIADNGTKLVTNVAFTVMAKDISQAGGPNEYRGYIYFHASEPKKIDAKQGEISFVLDPQTWTIRTIKAEWKETFVDEQFSDTKEYRKAHYALTASNIPLAYNHSYYELRYFLYGTDIANYINPSAQTCTIEMETETYNDKDELISKKRIKGRLEKLNFTGEGMLPEEESKQKNFKADRFEVLLDYSYVPFELQFHPFFDTPIPPRGQAGVVVATLIDNESTQGKYPEVVYYVEEASIENQCIWTPDEESDILSMFYKEIGCRKGSIIGVAFPDKQGKAEYNILRGLDLEAFFKMLKEHPQPHRFTISAAAFKWVDGKYKMLYKASIPAEIPGIARITKISTYAELDKVGSAEKKIRLSRKDKGTRAVYDKSYSQIPAAAASTLFYLFPGDELLMDKDDIAEVEWFSGLKMSIKTKRDIVGDKLAVVRIGGDQIPGQTSRSLYKISQSGWTSTVLIGGTGVIIATAHPYIAGGLGVAQIVIYILGWDKGETPFIVSEMHSTVVADFDPNSTTFYTIEGTNKLINPATGSTIEIAAGQKADVAPNGNFGKVSTFNNAELNEEIRTVLDWQSGKTTQPVPPVSKQVESTENLIVTPLDAPPMQNLPHDVLEVILDDNFDTENNGSAQLHYRGFTYWQVGAGEVDLIGHGFSDFCPEHGLYVDLDGSDTKAGTLQTIMEYSLPPGLYSLEFDLAGNPQRTINTVFVSLGNLYHEVFTLNPKEPFRTIQRDIIVTDFTAARLRFQHTGGDNAGLLLDNVRLKAIKK